MSHTITVLGDGDVHAVAAFLAPLQAVPTSHCTYVGLEPEAIAGELGEADGWRAQTLLARDADGSLAGVLQADIDAEMRRVYWLGPWAETGSADDDLALAQALMDDAARRFGDRYDQEELAPDERHATLLALAEARGFHADPASSVFSMALFAAPHGPDGARPATTLPLRPADHAAVITLHDALFGRTHTPGGRLVTDDDTSIRVAHLDGEVAGYVATQVHGDGTGYVDYLGVAPAARRRGLARALITDAMGDLAARGVPSVHLTVRVDAPGARELYISLGYREERVIAVRRKGFSLA